MAKTVLVTGGTGYIGGELIDQLLAGGWNVHTTVRDAAKSEPRLRGRWADAGDRLKVFSADLLNDGGWAEANAGCDAVAHVASPFPLKVPKHEDELVVPAREGTLRALRFAHAAGVTRFVQTSSAAAIAYGHPRSKTHFDHNDWTQMDGGKTPPYYKSKTVAEQAARQWVAENALDMAFCSINPVAVFGPVANDDLSTSIQMVKKMMDGSIPMLPDMGIGVVDVRDVAKMHVLALEAEIDDIRGERFPASQSFMWMHEMADAIRARIGEDSAKIPTKKMPDFLVKFLALFVSELKLIKDDLGTVRDVDGSHATEKLGMEYITAEQSIGDTAESLLEHGIVTADRGAGK